MAKNTYADIKENGIVQARSLLGNITASLENSDHYIADDDILKKVFDDPSVKKDFERITDYFNYYQGDSLANLHSFIMIFRAGMRVGAYYEIEDHKRNQYEYVDKECNERGFINA